MTLKLDDFDPVWFHKEFASDDHIFYTAKETQPEGCEHLYSASQFQKLIDQCNAKDTEIARLKTVPMKYRRMEFNAQLQQEVATLQAQNAELLADAERLDYMQDKLPESVLRFGENWYWRHGYGKPHRRAKSLREAIDAAIAKAKDQ